jgi:tetrahydromethanopterin S-methyltransferase subunit D
MFLEPESFGCPFPFGGAGKPALSHMAFNRVNLVYLYGIGCVPSSPTGKH